jgi:hypothetical protein
MTTITSLRAQVAALAAAAQPRPVRPHRRTTSENRQEFARILATISDPAPPTPAQKAECAAVYAELDSILARMDAREAASKGSHPIVAGISPRNQPSNERQ